MSRSIPYRIRLLQALLKDPLNRFRDIKELFEFINNGYPRPFYLYTPVFSIANDTIDNFLVYTVITNELTGKTMRYEVSDPFSDYIVKTSEGDHLGYVTEMTFQEFAKGLVYVGVKL